LLVSVNCTKIKSRASAEKFPGGGDNGKKTKNSKKDHQNSTIKPLPGEATVKKSLINIKNRPKNSTIKPLFTIFVPYIKIQGGHAPLPSVNDAHE